MRKRSGERLHVRERVSLLPCMLVRCLTSAPPPALNIGLYLELQQLSYGHEEANPWAKDGSAERQKALGMLVTLHSGCTSPGLSPSLKSKTLI